MSPTPGVHGPLKQCHADQSTLPVYAQIEQLSKTQRPRRSKSFTRGSDRVVTPTSRTASATQAELAVLRDGASALRDNASTPTRARMSIESLKSNSTTTSPEGRTSVERAKSLRRKFMTHSRSSSEKEAESRAQSEGRGSGEFEVRMLSLAAVSATMSGR